MAVVTRDEWGAGPHRAGKITLPVTRLFLHHTVTPEWTGADAARRLQDIARGRGFADISYSWLVDVDGNEIEGRGWGRQGAHTQGYNSTAHAICLIGNFDRDQVPAAMIRGAANLVRKHRSRGPGRITHGHRDVGQTACPGRHAYAAIGVINQAAAKAPIEEDDMPSAEEVADAVWARAPESGSDKGEKALFMLQQASRGMEARDVAQENQAVLADVRAKLDEALDLVRQLTPPAP